MQRADLRGLGESINHNAYGNDEHDVLIAPARLYGLLARWRDPLDAIANELIVEQLDGRRRADLALASAVQPHWQDAHGSVLLSRAARCRASGRRCASASSTTPTVARR
jgi:hypothetical protein